MTDEYNKDRQTRQIVKLNPHRIFFMKGLVEKILNLSSNEALELRAPILTGQFQRSGRAIDNTRKAYKHGLLLPLSQPITQTEAYGVVESPLQIRARDFDSLSRMKEQETNIVGFSFFPVQGKDREKRIVPLSSIADGMRLYTWVKNNFPEIKVEDYSDAKRALIEGGEFVVHIPSRTRRRVYRTKMSHVPVVDSPHKNAIVWSLDSNFQSGVEPEFSTYNIFFRYLGDVEGSDRKFMYPQQVAAMLAIADVKYRDDKNRVPWEMNPFPIMSQLAAEYDNRLRNNIVVYDSTIRSNKGLRKLHLAERSIMIGRLIGQLGHDRTMFWDSERDPKLRDYSWAIPIEN